MNSQKKPLLELISLTSLAPPLLIIYRAIITQLEVAVKKKKVIEK